ncbi:MAG: glucose-1-phosphate thymidylyltransferase, partial [Desulfobacula sp.]|nr:glucose-1-phosphate thymidylyltransferase [Desulfobacula sp.]
VVVILGDNIFQDSISEDVRSFIEGGRIFLKEVSDANRFGVAELNENRVVGIEEKPEVPKSNYAVTGLYMYDGEVFDVISMLEPSGRGELEITDVNNYYIDQGRMGYKVLDGYWSDAGTFESLLRAGVMVERERGMKNEVQGSA